MLNQHMNLKCTCNLIFNITQLYNVVYTITLTIRDFPHEGCIGVDVDATLLSDRVLVGRRGKTKVTDLDVTRS